MEDIKKNDVQVTNKAHEVTEEWGPFLTPMASDDSEFIRTVAEFALELTPGQNAALTNIDTLCFNPNLSETARKAFANKKQMFLKNKRYHDAKFFISDAIQSMSWRKFVMVGAVQGNVNKTAQM